VIVAIAVVAGVGYLSVTRHDIQRAADEQAVRYAAVSDDVVGR
jgi:hypothetical protein